MADSIDRLYEAVLLARSTDANGSRTAKLFRDGLPKMAKKMAEEAIEVGLDAVQGNRQPCVQVTHEQLLLDDLGRGPHGSHSAPSTEEPVPAVLDGSRLT